MGVFKSYDIRGVYNRDWDEDLAYRIGFFLPELLETDRILVGRDGSVLGAEVKGPIKGEDRVCFDNAALAAARSSRFRIDINAPDKQRALITYSFVAQ